MNYQYLRELLDAHGISLRKLAARVGVSYNTLGSCVRRESKKIPIETVMKIAEVLGADWRLLSGLDDYGNGVYAHEMEPDQAAKWEKRLGLTQNDEEELLQAFRALNADGKRECLKRVHELGELRQYKG